MKTPVTFLILSLLMIADIDAQTTITLDANDKGRVFEGIGAVSAGASTRNLLDYPQKQRSEVLDFLFKPNSFYAKNH
ncbi:hypothetical protein [Pedobacter miscanthi]|jgi:galactosylceramidase|uniref:hypothetical protein n=1 Tax=Pedobacter miscanthi TaxID=2259170 RepID=UPI002930FD03|nr:hypothetical protein [Pedobacter miscanthi]